MRQLPFRQRVWLHRRQREVQMGWLNSFEKAHFRSNLSRYKNSYIFVNMLLIDI